MASDLRPGLRIREVTKLIGNLNVPRGQRSIIAFLDIPKPTVTSSDMSRANQVISEAKDGPIPLCAILPQKSKRPAVAPGQSYCVIMDMNPWLVPARIMTPREMMSSGAGWVVHGVGHISNYSFEDPEWSPSVIHFASRQKFQVFWMSTVMTFHDS
jgi:hypothetical protein